MVPDYDKLVTDADGWQHFGARFVGCAEWLEHVEHLDDRLSFGVFAKALAEAATDDGLLANFDPIKFCERDISAAISDENHEPGWSVNYDRFTAMVLHDLQMEFAFRGLLARRHGGDYRLALPLVQA